MAVTRFGLKWLAEQSAARLLRHNWSGSQGIQTFAEELWTILTKLRDNIPEAVNIPTSDGVRELLTKTIEQIDKTFRELENEIVDHEHPTTDPSFGSNSRVEWDRAALPCKVGTQVSGKTYNVTLYPFGDMVPLDANDDPNSASTYASIEDSPHTIQTTGKQLQLRDGEVIPEGSWTVAVYLQQFRINESTRNGAVISHDMIVLQTGCFIQLPVWM